VHGSEHQISVASALMGRGRRSGAFTRSMSAEWLVPTIIGLGHAAGRDAGAGRMTLDAAARGVPGERPAGVPRRGRRRTGHVSRPEIDLCCLS
jgi:hypothetical protein